MLPLAPVLYEGVRSDLRTFPEFLKPVRKRLRELSGQPKSLAVVVIDGGASSRENLENMEHSVTALRRSNHRATRANCAACTRRWRAAGAGWRRWPCVGGCMRKPRRGSGIRSAAVSIFAPCPAIGWSKMSGRWRESVSGATGTSTGIWPRGISDFTLRLPIARSRVRRKSSKPIAGNRKPTTRFAIGRIPERSLRGAGHR